MASWYPAHTRYQKGTENYLWIYLHPRKLKYTSYVENWSSRNRIEVQEAGMEKMYFLAPQEIQDSISHEWQPLENIVSKIANVISSAKQSISLGTSIHKVETPLAYNGTDRRKISIMVNFGVYRDAYWDVIRPVELLRKYSAPSYAGEQIYSTEVEVPAVFKLLTKTGAGTVIPIINMRHAVLTAVQPTFSGPYIQGYPSKCELTLEFMDMEPLTKNTFERVTTYNTSHPAGGR